MIVAARQPGHDLIGEAPLGRSPDAGLIVRRRDAAQADVLARGDVKAHEVLEDHADPASQVHEVVVAQVMPVEQDPSLGRVVKTG